MLRINIRLIELNSTQTFCLPICARTTEIVLDPMKTGELWEAATVTFTAEKNVKVQERVRAKE